MRFLQLLIPLLIGGPALWLEFRSIKEYSLFTVWYHAAPFWALVVLTGIYLITGIRQYMSFKKYAIFLPLLVCLSLLTIVLWHQKIIETLDSSPTKFTVMTDDIGSDGGFILDFKVNGYVKAEKRDRFLVTYYRGHYSQQQDTITLDLPLNFHMPKRALIRRDSFQLIGDTTRFYVIQP